MIENIVWIVDVDEFEVVVSVILIVLWIVFFGVGFSGFVVSDLFEKLECIGFVC